MIEALIALVQSLARRPEILGMVALGLSLAWAVRRKQQVNGGPMFKLVIRTTTHGMYMLGAVLIIRELGRQLDRFF